MLCNFFLHGQIVIKHIWRQYTRKNFPGDNNISNKYFHNIYEKLFVVLQINMQNLPKIECWHVGETMDLQKKQLSLIKYIKKIAILLCAFFIFCSGIVADASSDKTQSNILTVGVPIDRCPVFYKEQNGKITGIGADLMTIAANNAGYDDVIFKEVQEDSLKSALDNSEYDVVLPFGSAITSTNNKQSIVTESLLEMPFILVTLKDKTLPPLTELKVGMISSLQGGIDTISFLYPDVKITTYDSMKECIEALRGNKVDALLHNSYVWSYILQKPFYSNLVVQPTSMFTMSFRAGTLDTEDGQEVIARLNNGIKTLSNAQRQAIVLDYTTRKLYHYNLFDYIYTNIWAIIFIILLIVLFISMAIQRQKSYKRKHEQVVKELIEKDTLTGAYSIAGFKRKVKELIRQNPNIPYLISYNNIKNFKYINDLYGRDIGNEILKFWAKQYKDILSDDEAIGRIVGDEIIVCRKIVDEDQVSKNEAAISRAINKHFFNEGQETLVKIYTGIYVLTKNDYQEMDVDKMIDCAVIAANNLLISEQNSYQIYNPQQWEKEKLLIEIQNHLSIAISTGEIKVWYQPQIDCHTNEIVGAEALCRWHHPKLGWLAPDIFIPILEDANMIFTLDSYVWECVCRDLQRWNNKGMRRSVSINLSRADIQEKDDICEHLKSLVDNYELHTEQLKVEITETAYVDKPDILIDTTNKLREAGFQVEMDDFGSGYSSLHMLKEIPVDKIKVDLHFLTQTENVEKSHIIIRYIIQMIEALNLKLIVEGVETKEQMEFLKQSGCHEMQGYYFYKPMPCSDFEEIL